MIGGLLSSVHIITITDPSVINDAVVPNKRDSSGHSIGESPSETIRLKQNGFS